MFIEEGMDLLKSVLPEEDMKSDDIQQHIHLIMGILGLNLRIVRQYRT